MSEKRVILSGDEAVAYGAMAAGVRRGAGYPGTPSTEILETLTKIGGKAQWAPNEKVALEVGIGISLGGARTIVTMKHVGMNVAADPLFTLTYMGVHGGMVIVSADDPGMASSQNEQDNRNYAKFAQMPMLEPSDSQEAYDFAIRAFELSEACKMPVLLRMTTRVCHAQSPVVLHREPVTAGEGSYVRDVQTKVMIPAFARKAHVRLVQTMKALAEESEKSDLNVVIPGSTELGVITSGAAFQHTKEATDAAVLKLGMTWPIPVKKIAEFVKGVKRAIVVEEGSRFLEEAILAAGIAIERKDEIFEYGELNAARVKKLLAHDVTPDVPGAPGRPPALCPGCPHRKTFELLHDLGCIVCGDIGCYTLGVLPPYSAMDVSCCMGASIGLGLGMRHALGNQPDARKIVSVIGDSTFFHSGLTGIADMVYNRPATGHVVIILDNRTTAMTGLQENPATGYYMNLTNAPEVNMEETVKAMGVDFVKVIDPVAQNEEYRALLQERLAVNETTVLIARRSCLLQMKKLAKLAKKAGEKKA